MPVVSARGSERSNRRHDESLEDVGGGGTAGSAGPAAGRSCGRPGVGEPSGPLLARADDSNGLRWAWRAAVGAASRRRRDSRTVLIALACTTAAGFLGLHALATPGVLLGSNSGFELATPVGLASAGVIAAISAVEFRPPAADRILERSGWLLASTVTAMGVWAAASLAELPPLDQRPVTGRG